MNVRVFCSKCGNSKEVESSKEYPHPINAYCQRCGFIILHYSKWYK